MAKPAFRFKKLWFDDKKVRRMLSRKERKALARFGATVRKHAQYSMKTKKGPAPPGQPPHAHGDKLLKRMLYFSYDAKAKSVIVGPALLQNKASLHVPRTLEKGGQGTWVFPSGARIKRNYEARHYMVSAATPYYGKIAQWYAEA